MPVFFETLGPTTTESQPRIFYPVKRKQVRSKIEKIIYRRQMLRTGVDIKSLICYFGVPKGKDDIRVVYDATTNCLN